MNRKVVFCGFGPLAYKCLIVLFENEYNIGCVLTHQDNLENKLEMFCTKNEIPLYYQNPKTNVKFYRNIFRGDDGSILISVNYRFIIPKEIFKCFIYSINIHGSLLPKYRGRAPHIWAIINGEKYTGVTCHYIVEDVDAGDILFQKKIKIEADDTGNDLIIKFQKVYPEVLLESLKKLGNETVIKQNEDEATYYGKRIPEMGYLDPYQPTQRIIDFIRALAPPYPGAYFFNRIGRKIIIEKVSIESNIDYKNNAVGCLEEKNGIIYLNCLENLLRIEKYYWEDEK